MFVRESELYKKLCLLHLYSVNCALLYAQFSSNVLFTTKYHKFDSTMRKYYNAEMKCFTKNSIYVVGIFPEVLSMKSSKPLDAYATQFEIFLVTI